MSIDFHGSPITCSGGAIAGLEGFGSGILGVLGLGGLVNPTGESDKELEQARQDLAKATSDWNQRLSDAKSGIVQDQLTYLQNLTNFTSVQSSAVEASLQEQISINFTLIIMLICLVIFLIIFDLI